jgi:hypothetical protein
MTWSPSLTVSVFRSRSGLLISFVATQTGLSLGQQLLADAALASAGPPTDEESGAVMEQMERSLLAEQSGRVPHVLLGDIDDGLRVVLRL